MAYRTILVELGTDRRDETRVDLAITLARRFDARLRGVLVVPPLRLPPSFASPVLFEAAQVEAHRQALARAADEVIERFRGLADRAGVSSESELLEGEPGRLLAGRARLADLAIVSQREQNQPGRRVPEAVVLGSGRATLIVPYAGTFETIGERVLLAWNGSREAARAMAEAMPFLGRATSVLVLEMDPGPEPEASIEAARALAAHGVRAEARHTVTAGVAAGEILLSTAAETGADLLVMGAYGHTRLRELALGGVTRTVFAHMTLPVLAAY